MGKKRLLAVAVCGPRLSVFPLAERLLTGQHRHLGIRQQPTARGLRECP